VTREESQASAAWRPGIGGYSVDILPWIDAIAPTRPKPLALVEIGVLYGRSILYWAERLRQLGHGADTRLVGVDMPVLDPDGHAVLKRNLEETRSAWEPVTVELDLRPSVEAAASYADGSFDIAFIDGSHKEADVRADIEAWRRKVRAGGILAGHDYGWRSGDHAGVKIAVDALLGPVEHRDSVWWQIVTREPIARP
jgi:predicted O-methyltransferase YrrM